MKPHPNLSQVVLSCSFVRSCDFPSSPISGKALGCVGLLNISSISFLLCWKRIDYSCENDRFWKRKCLNVFRAKHALWSKFQFLFLYDACYIPLMWIVTCYGANIICNESALFSCLMTDYFNVLTLLKCMYFSLFLTFVFLFWFFIWWVMCLSNI